MDKSKMLPAFGANENAVGFAHLDQMLAVEAIRAICPPCGIDYVTVAGDMDATLHAGGNKGAVRFFRAPFAARFKAALCGILAALALGFPVGALETTTLGQKGEKLTAEQYAQSYADAKTEKKTDNRRLQKLGEKRTRIHQVTFCIGFVAGMIAGVGLIYAIIWLIATIWG